MNEYADVAIIGAGAAGLMAAIHAGRTFPDQKIVLLDGAKTLGAKILVAGGGRCNVTHDHVDESAYAGSSRNAIKKVLRRFDVPRTIEFFREIGVELKREETGKLFPVTDSAKTVLNALLKTLDQTSVRLRYPYRVESVQKQGEQFLITGAWGELRVSKIILATGGRSLPKSGSDGHGYTLAKSLGHHMTARFFPALVPLTLPSDHFLCQLSGVSLPATLEVRAGNGKKLAAFTNSTLFTHFGLSGPGVLDISRYYIDAKLDDPGASLVINFLPENSQEQLEQTLLKLGRTSLIRWLSEQLPERLARALCAEFGVDPGVAADQITREQRKNLVKVLTALALPITGNRGYNYAEVTAGGVPLSDIHLDTMESRLCRSLYFCGEICDVDGQIGGYNFQWAWASGYLAGMNVGKSPSP